MGRVVAWVIAVVMVPLGMVAFLVPAYYSAQGYIAPWWPLAGGAAALVFIVVGMFAFEIGINW